MAFFETPRFPDDLSYSSKATTGYKTDINEQQGGSESRLIRWQQARRSYDAAFSVRTIGQLESLLNFFHSCSGRAHGFRFRDPIDNQSSPINTAPSSVDQIIIPITGSTTQFQLRKRYNSGASVYRDIKKPVSGSVKLALDGLDLVSGFTVDYTTGIVTFSIAPVGVVTAGFSFDVPCRFDTDDLETSLISYQKFQTSVPILEIKP